MHTGPVAGDFTSDKKKSGMKCPFCDIAGSVFYQEWESSCGGYEDYHYECTDCGKTWWVEGPDS